MNLLAVFIGGGLGSMLRYGFYIWFHKPDTIIPYGTFLANATSSLILGGLIATLAQSDKSNFFYLLIATGFCGGFSTFSTFSAENFQLIQQGLWFNMAVNVVGNVVICLMAVFLGYKVLNG